MVSVELGDMEELARRNSNGNLSQYLRRLIYEDQKKKPIRHKTYIFQLFCFVILGLMFFIFALDATVILPLSVFAIMLSITGTCFIFLAVLLYHTMRKQEVETHGY